MERDTMNEDRKWRTIGSPRTPSAGKAFRDRTIFGEGFDAMFALRQMEADEFYASRYSSSHCPTTPSRILRLVLCGMVGCKQFYTTTCTLGLEALRRALLLQGAPEGPETKKWTQLYNDDIISMPKMGSIPGTPHGIWRFTAFPSR